MHTLDLRHKTANTLGPTMLKYMHWYRSMKTSTVILAKGLENWF